MGLYRKFARSKKGMSTIFGALFFVILILMGFNLMLWGFIQTDAYNSVINSMSQRDQLASSENLVPAQPGATGFNIPLQTFNITVNNLGGTTVSIARIYIINLSPTGTNPVCVSGPCIVDPNPASPGFTGGNVPAGEINHLVGVSGILINDGSGYKVILASTRGRLFAFFYPWPQTVVNNGQGIFQTNVGPLTIFFDFKSFNYTLGTQTQSNGAWIVPVSTNVVFWIKVQNSATDSDVTLKVYSSLLFQPYSAGGVGGFSPFFIVDKNTVNPSGIIPYNENTNPYLLPHADPSGPSGFTIVKFASRTGPVSPTLGSSSPQSFPNTADTWIVFIGFYYLYKGQFQGQTIPFVAMRTCKAGDAVFPCPP